MNAYKNTHSNVIYPFVQPVPFPLGWVQDVKLGLKVQAANIFISAIGTTENGFYIQLQTENSYIGHFQSQQEWLTVDNSVAFGFVKFGGIQQAPKQQKFSGRWRLCRSCYTLPVTLSGISKVAVNGQQLAQPQNNILEMQITGDLSQRTPEAFNVVNIGRDGDAHTDYNKIDNSIETQTGISGVNGAEVRALIIKSQDEDWLKVGSVTEVKKGSGNYVLYLESADTFQSCDLSDSQSYFPPWPIEQPVTPAPNIDY